MSTTVPYWSNMQTLTRRFSSSASAMRWSSAVFATIARAPGSAAARAALSAFLNRRTGYRAVGAEDAAVSRPRAQHRAAALAFVEDDAGIRRHRLRLREPARRAGEGRAPLDGHRRCPAEGRCAAVGATTLPMIPVWRSVRSFIAVLANFASFAARSHPQHRSCSGYRFKAARNSLPPRPPLGQSAAPMTWSIVARDPATGAFGVAVATRFFAVGALCPHAASGIGALATQALVNPLWGKAGIALLEEGVPAADAVARLVAADGGRDYRQLHMIDRAGRIAAHTGSGCIDWCGHLAGEEFSVAGNMLVGASVIEATAAAYRAAEGPFAQRLLAALDAGDAEGGDKRGRQSAALLIYAGEDYPYLDLRVDDHETPLPELRRLWEVARRSALPFLRFLPTRADPVGTTDRAVIQAELARVQEELGPMPND